LAGNEAVLKASSAEVGTSAGLTEGWTVLASEECVIELPSVTIRDNLLADSLGVHEIALRAQTGLLGGIVDSVRSTRGASPVNHKQALKAAARIRDSIIYLILSNTLINAFTIPI